MISRLLRESGGEAGRLVGSLLGKPRKRRRACRDSRACRLQWKWVLLTHLRNSREKGHLSLTKRKRNFTDVPLVTLENSYVWIFLSHSQKGVFYRCLFWAVSHMGWHQNKSLTTDLTNNIVSQGFCFKRRFGWFTNGCLFTVVSFGLMIHME